MPRTKLSNPCCQAVLAQYPQLYKFLSTLNPNDFPPGYVQQVSNFLKALVSWTTDQVYDRAQCQKIFCCKEMIYAILNAIKVYLAEPEEFQVAQNLILTLNCILDYSDFLPMNCDFDLTTLFTSNNGQSGNMFDVVALNDLFLNQFELNLDSGTFTIEIYVVNGGGTWVGNENNPGAWQLIATYPGITSAGIDIPTVLPILPVPYPIYAGNTQGLYITVVTSTAMNYTNGTGVGNIAASDGNLQILEGAGKSYPFGATFIPRIWNGTIHYCTLAESAGEVILANFAQMMETPVLIRDSEIQDL